MHKTGGAAITAHAGQCAGLTAGVALPSRIRQLGGVK
jgi:hypothetical protein